MLNPDLMWVTYRGTFDMGYMLKAATSERLPDTESGFLDRLQTYFPHFYDIKCMLRDTDLPTASLSSTATLLNVSWPRYSHRYNEQESSTRQEATVW